MSLWSRSGPRILRKVAVLPNGANMKAAAIAVLLGGFVLGSVQDLSARQATPHTAEFWAGLAGWSGEKARSFSTGPATGATFLFHVGLPVQLGLDLGFARMDTDQVVGEVDEFTGSFAARLRAPFLIRFRPFLGMRAGYTRLSADLETLRFEQNGGFVGGNLGVEVPLGSRVLLTGTGEALYYGYRDTTLFLEDIPVPSTGGNAWRYAARLGLSFRWRH